MEEKDFLQLISLHQGIIHKVCNLYRDSPEDRQDLFQEIVFQLWRSVDNFRRESKVSTFIYRIAINTAIASFRKDRTKNLLEFRDKLPELPMEREDRNLSERKDALTAAIKKLDESDRALMVLVLEDMTYREIAEVIGISENNVAVKINRIKEKLKKIIKV